MEGENKWPLRAPVVSGTAVRSVSCGQHLGLTSVRRKEEDNNDLYFACISGLALLMVPLPNNSGHPSGPH